MPTPIKALRGVWTPWALVLCYACNNETRADHPSHRVLPASHEVPQPNPYDMVVPCHACERPIWMCEDVALPYMVIQSLASTDGIDGVMQQTGGMCSAALFTRTGTDPWDEEGNPREDVPFVYVTALEGPLDVGFYASAKHFEDGECEDFTGLGSMSPDANDSAALVAQAVQLVTGFFTQEV